MGPRPPTPATRILPGPGQESVWDFPRPPRVEPSAERVVVRFGGQVVADSGDAVRVLETSHPRVYYLPRAAFAEGVLVEAPDSSVCEFKGAGRYLDLRVGRAVARRAAWYYPAAAGVLIADRSGNTGAPTRGDVTQARTVGDERSAAAVTASP